MIKATLSDVCVSNTYSNQVKGIEEYVLAVLVVELKVETKNASGTIEMAKRKKVIKLTAKFVFVKKAAQRSKRGAH